MDAENSLMDSSKRQKISSPTKLEDMPEEILTKIMCLLPLKDSMGTSVLAKQWKDVWKAINEIEVKEEQFRNRPQFRELVDKLLTVLNSPIRKFSLKCEVRKDTTKVNQWLTGFTTPSLEHLKLRFQRVDEPLVFPAHLFTSKSLTHLSLHMLSVINLPSSIHFPNLKTLTLKDVIFPDTPQTQQLFSGCPSLEELKLIDCIWVNVRQVWIVCPLLQSLIIREWGDFDSLASLPNVNPFHCCAINICESHNLEIFSYDGDILNSYYLTSTSVTDVTLDIQEPPFNSIVNPDHFVFTLLKAISNAEKLSISNYVIETLQSPPQMLTIIPWFNNLTELFVGDQEPVNLASPPLLTILRHAPNLEILEFHKGVFLDKSCVDKIGPAPECFKTNLEFIRIDNFGGTVEELYAIRTLIEWSMVLDYLYMYGGPQFDRKGGNKRLGELWVEILRSPGASRIAYISLF